MGNNLWPVFCDRIARLAAVGRAHARALGRESPYYLRLEWADVDSRTEAIDESEELDIAVFDVPGIKDYNPAGKAFLRTLGWQTAPARAGEMIVGCGYPGDGRRFRSGRWEQDIMVWAHRRCTVSESGRRLLLDGHLGKGKTTYFTNERPKSLALPGISGAPLFVLRDTLDWVGIVRSGCGTPPKAYSIQATPSGFVGADGHIAADT